MSVFFTWLQSFRPLIGNLLKPKQSQLHSITIKGFFAQILVVALFVIKEFAHAFSCAYIELWMHLGSLESTQEARVALGYRLVQLLRIFRALQTSRVHP